MTVHREGRVCRWCGYPVAKDSDTSLCVTCVEWCAATGGVNEAVSYAAHEQEKERTKRREERRK